MSSHFAARVSYTRPEIEKPKGFRREITLMEVLRYFDEFRRANQPFFVYCDSETSRELRKMICAKVHSLLTRSRQRSVVCEVLFHDPIVKDEPVISVVATVRNGNSSSPHLCFFETRAST